MEKTANKEESISLLNGWKNMLSEHRSLKERMEEGKLMRDYCSRAEHGDWKPPRNREDQLELLKSQEASRLEELIPLRYGRMMQSPFAFYRGSALIMANDLGPLSHSGLNVQLCGDCHLSNFGIFATPERNIIFDLNDFDETLPGPFEWDLKRLAASIAVAADEYGFSKRVAAKAVEGLCKIYRTKMEEYANMNTLEVWYTRVDWQYLIGKIRMPGRRKSAFDQLDRLKEKRSHAAALAKLTEIADGKRRIKDDPPLIFHSPLATDEAIKMVLHSYSETLWESRRRLLERYRFIDVAAKVVGVGSVGTAAAVALLRGEGGDEDYIFLQVKQALPSVLERYVGRSQFTHPGERIVNGQRLTQAASDMFLGWTSGPKRDFYVRQLMDLKDSVAVDELDATTFRQYAEVCGLVLARAHARTGDPAMIYGYLGKSTAFDEAILDFSFKYCKQNERDYESLVQAVKKGKIKATTKI